MSGNPHILDRQASHLGGSHERLRSPRRRTIRSSCPATNAIPASSVSNRPRRGLDRKRKACACSARPVASAKRNARRPEPIGHRERGVAASHQRPTLGREAGWSGSGATRPRVTACSICSTPRIQRSPSTDAQVARSSGQRGQTPSSSRCPSASSPTAQTNGKRTRQPVPSAEQSELSDPKCATESCRQSAHLIHRGERSTSELAMIRSKLLLLVMFMRLHLRSSWAGVSTPWVCVAQRATHGQACSQQAITPA